MRSWRAVGESSGCASQVEQGSTVCTSVKITSWSPSVGGLGWRAPSSSDVGASRVMAASAMSKKAASPVVAKGASAAGSPMTLAAAKSLP